MSKLSAVARLGAWALAIVLLATIALLVAPILFTRDIYLSCAGTTDYVEVVNGQSNSTKVPVTRSLHISITQYPLGHPASIVRTENETFIDSIGNGGPTTTIRTTDQIVTAGWRLSNNLGESVQLIEFNRLTKSLDVQKRNETRGRGASSESRFVGTCTEAKPL